MPVMYSRRVYGGFEISRYIDAGLSLIVITAMSAERAVKRFEAERCDGARRVACERVLRR
jgi:hypothetical protein